MPYSEHLPQVFSQSDPTVAQALKVGSMADAMELAMQRARDIDDPDPDPYGYTQELEEEYGVDLLTPDWKARPNDPRWVKRTKGRARKAVVAAMFLQGKPVSAIALKVRASETTVYKDLAFLGQEWRKRALGDIELIAAQDLARLEYLFLQLGDGIERGDTKSITAALEIIKERGQILGYRSGVQVDYEQYVREVAESAGFDPDKAVQIATRISVTMH